MNAKQKIRVLISLFLSFLKIGTFTFGGGYAMIPLIQREIVQKRGWINDDDILEIIAISESTPGPIAINMATFIGYRTGGVIGAFCATFGVVLPSFVIISIIACLLGEFQNIKAVKYAFWGIHAGVLSLIVKALYTMYKKTGKNAVSYIVMALAFVSVAVFKINVLLVIVTSAVIGIVTSFYARRRLHK